MALFRRHEVHREAAPEEFVLDTVRGEVSVRPFALEGATAAVVLVGGVGGGWDAPARGLYPALQRSLAEHGVGTLRVRYRRPTDLPECVHDVGAGVDLLQERGIGRIGFVGHSLGGAVVARAAAAAGDRARAVVLLATQAAGTDAVSRVAPGCGVLLIHGTRDPILPPDCSRYVHQLAPEPKRILLIDGATHGLDEAADLVLAETQAWLLRYLTPPLEPRA